MMEKQLLEKQISFEKLHELLIQSTVLTLSTLTGMRKKEIRKLQPTASAGIFLANLLRVVLTEFDMFSEKKIIVMANSIIDQAILNMPEHFK